MHFQVTFVILCVLFIMSGFHWTTRCMQILHQLILVNMSVHRLNAVFICTMAVQNNVFMSHETP